MQSTMKLNISIALAEGADDHGMQELEVCWLDLWCP